MSILSVLLWPLMIAIQTPLWLLGFPVVAYLAWRRQWRIRTPGGRPFWWRPCWAFVWGNENDGISGPLWWWKENPTYRTWKLIFVWSAWRNPVNNLRLVRFLHPVIDPKRIRFYGNSNDPARNGDLTTRKRVEWAFTWQGIYSGFVLRWQITPTHHFSVRLGWKLLPADRFGVPATDHRYDGCPFATQLHLWRKST